MSSPYHVKVTFVKHWNEGLFTFRTERPAAFRFKAGEFVMLGLEGTPMRAYSLVNPTWDEGLEFLSIHVPDGALTSKLVNIEVGDEILIGRKTTGTLTLDCLIPGKRLHLISTGTGLGPFMSIVREEETYDRFEKISLQHTVRHRQDLAYHDALLQLLAGVPMIGDRAVVQLHYDAAVTRVPADLLTVQRTYSCRRITERLMSGEYPPSEVAHTGLDPEVDRFMLCGSIPMITETSKILEGMGFVEGSHQEPGTFVLERAFAG